MFKKILTATDGSDHGTKAVELASELAAKYGAKLVLVHVLQHGRVPESVQKMLEAEHLIESRQPQYPQVAHIAGGLVTAMGTGAQASDASYRVFEALGDHMLETAKQVARDHGVKDIRKVIEDGDPAQRILACADRENADLVVVGSRGLSDLKGMLMGSVSHKLIQLAKCTCIAVK
ncbi:MAG: universal stress protein [Gammaproteobacteria bacterium]|jgi:nucleotide-binding universal stress UspA family protein|nr:universal stress protein [Gammaproteobacteria bacterium]